MGGDILTRQDVRFQFGLSLIISHAIRPGVSETRLREMIFSAENRHFLRRILREESISVKGHPPLRQAFSYDKRLDPSCSSQPSTSRLKPLFCLRLD